MERPFLKLSRKSSAGICKNYLLYDSIGCLTQSGQFQVAGTSNEMLYGACEAFYKENMDSEQLFETCSQCLLAGVNRDCSSGWGAAVFVLTPGKIAVKRLKSRQD